ncbi:MAG: thioredoxin domain-containing protein [Microbacteriaceae bacterium]|nr:thioredoxin domain-containing protein [Microbacteriaceae bacterium]
MSNTPGGRLTKNEKRELAREQARVLREQARKKEKRNRILLQGGIIVGVLAVVAVIALVIVTSIRPPVPGPRNMASDGLLIQAGGEVLQTPGLAAGATPTPAPTADDGEVLRIQTYVDFFCPICGAFEATNAAYIRQLVESGAASLEIIPVSFLDRVSLGTKYATRAMNAFACVADGQPSAAWAFHDLLFQNQPAEQTVGLSDDELVEFARQAGAKSATVESCIRDLAFGDWVEQSTDRSTGSGITGTPTVFVNGQQYEGSVSDAATFRQFVASAQGAQFVEDNAATPTPTPTPTA